MLQITPYTLIKRLILFYQKLKKNATDLHLNYDTSADTFKGENTEAKTFEQHDPISAVEIATSSLPSSVAHTHPFPTLNDDGTLH